MNSWLTQEQIREIKRDFDKAALSPTEVTDHIRHTVNLYNQCTCTCPASVMNRPIG